MDFLISIGLLLSTIMLFQVRKISDSIMILALQSFLLSMTALIFWWKTGFTGLLLAAVFTLLVKAIFIPFVLLRLIKKMGTIRDVERYTTQFLSLLIALILSALGYYVASNLDLPGMAHGRTYLPVSIILIILGTAIMIDHKKAIMQGVGLITIENGIFLISESIAYGMPLVVDLGIFFDLLVIIIVIGILLLRIQATFESLNTSNLQQLKG